MASTLRFGCYWFVSQRVVRLTLILAQCITARNTHHAALLSTSLIFWQPPHNPTTFGFSPRYSYRAWTSCISEASRLRARMRSGVSCMGWGGWLFIFVCVLYMLLRTHHANRQEPCRSLPNKHNSKRGRPLYDSRVFRKHNAFYPSHYPPNRLWG